MCFLDFDGAMVPEKKLHFHLVHVPIKSFYFYFYFLFLTFQISLVNFFKFILMKAQLQYHSFPSHGFFAPCFIGLWSIYNKALILLSWAFTRMHIEIFNPLSQTWAYNVFITVGLFNPFSSFWAQTYNKEAQDQGSSYWICRILDTKSIAYLLPQAQSPLFQKGFFKLGL